ncbi:MAG TPA: LamG-like jellyroll fold domain-containing protein, partial [Desulfuromonadaceae bacterium]|nr:LamG-like jellyroll fold domain-containing protein [Desulfuromonadaceae bacterium]
MKALTVAVLLAVIGIVGSAGVARGQCTPPPSGLVGWWKLDGNANDNIAGNNGTVFYGLYTSGVVGQGISFDPDNTPWSGIQLADRPSYALTNELTIEGWVRPTGNGYLIFWRGDSRPGTDPYQLSMQGDNRLRFYISDNADNVAYVEATLALNQWWHVAAVYSNGTMSLYTNGVLASQTTTSLHPFGALNPSLHPGVGIGNLNDGGNDFPFIGVIDEIGLYNRALSGSEIASIYAAGSAGKCTSSSGPPIITSFSPSTANAGASVTITGNNFSPTAANDIVYFGTVRATVTSASSTSLTVTVPSGAVYGPLTVTVSGLIAYANSAFTPTFAGGATLNSSSLGTRFDLPTGDCPTMTTADVDGDGKPDLIAINGCVHTVSIFRNISTNGTLTASSFAPQVVLPQGTGCGNGVVAADVDGDGKLDIVTIDADSNVIMVLRNQCVPGNITSNSFAPRVNFTVGSQPRGVAIRDLDGDGKPELITANWGGDSISVLRNVGTAGSITSSSFAPATAFATPAGSSPQNVMVADLNGDGKPDVVSVNDHTDSINNAVSVFQNTSSGVGTISFGPRVDLQGPIQSYAVVPGDLDGDGKSDIVFVSFNYGESLSVYRNLNTGGSITAGSFATRVDFPLNAWGNDLTIGDVDGDGKPDVAVTTQLPDHLYLFQNMATPGSFTSNSLAAPVSYASGWNPYGPSIIDLDGDGRSDIVFANDYGPTISVYQNTVTATVGPTILLQPVNQIVPAGTNVTFKVIASGTSPLSYQWRFNGTNIAGATSSTFTVNNVQPVNAGLYSVRVANFAGSVISSNAVLTVVSGSCASMPSGLVAFWSAENSANDSVAGTVGTVNGSLGYGTGEVGQAFVLDGSTSYIHYPATSSFNVGTNNGFTIEGWIKPTAGNLDPAGPGAPVIEWDSASNDGLQLWSQDRLYANLKDTFGSAHPLQAAPGLLSSNVFQHVALTYNKSSGFAALYLNGVIVASNNFGNITPQTSYPVNIGRRTGQPVGLNDTYGGSIDELSLYNRALSTSEIQSIYAAGSNGKCTPLLAPTIVTQPTSRTVTVGQSTTFTVSATGTAPLYYRWLFNGGTIFGATNSSFTVTNIQLSQAGNYMVVVTNAIGSTNSVNAVLTVNPATCTSAPSGLVALWQAESNANDTIGGNNGTPTGALGYGAGLVGQAFVLDGSTSYIQVPASSSLNLGANNGFTIEGWIKPTAGNLSPSGPGAPVIEWDSTSSDGLQLWSQDRLYANLKDTSGISHPLQAAPGLLSSNVFQHVALTYDKSSGFAALYLNGAIVASNNFGNITPQTTYPVNIGRRTGQPVGLGDTYGGSIDELSLYSRALSTSEIQSIYNANSSGKCTPLSPPTIVTQPTNRTVTVGQSTTFTVSATGTGPLRYQWRFNGASVAGATNSTLTLSNIQVSQAGNYSVLVTNVLGAAASSNAVLTVTGTRPGIITQPANQWTVVGGAVTFTVSATGTGPLNYQWKFNGANIGGATGASLTLTNVQLAQAGNYSVTVTNAFGSTNSINAALTVVTSCTDVPSGIVAWWRAETNTTDVFGLHNGTFVNGSSYAGGIVGQAFNLTGTNYVSVPDAPALNPTNAITVECWINHQSIVGSYDAVVKKSGQPGVSSANGYSLEFAGSGILFWVYSSNSGWQSSGVPIQLALGVWYHVAGVYDGTHLMVYTNGHLAATSSVTGTIVPSTNSLCIGNDPLELVRYFKGGIDEVAIYNRALSAGEIADVFHASSFGKCVPLFPPVIVTQPTNRTVTVGGSTTFTVSATGTDPLAYQWKLNGTDIAGATSATLTLTNIQFSQAGNYSVTVSNVVGLTNSANAVLTVNRPPVADAGATIPLVISVNGTNASVVLDGSQSYDLDGDPLQYQWFENSTNYLTNGVVA